MKTILTTIFLWLMGTVATWAQNTVSIYQVDGKVAVFSFAEKPVVTYSGDNLVLTTNKTTVQYPIYQLKKLAFDVDWDAETKVEELKQPDAQFRFQNGTLCINGGEAGSQVCLYNLKGVVAGRYRLDANGCASISTENLKKDIYMVKTKFFTFKFFKP